MTEKICPLCGISNQKERFVNAVCEEEIMHICERCAFVEDLPVIKRASAFQLKKSEKPYTVDERLRRMVGLEAGNAERFRKELEKLKERKEIRDISLNKLRELKKKKQHKREEKHEPLELIDSFHWHVQRERMKRKLTKKQLANAIAESEIAIKMIESGDLPDDAGLLIRKLEQFLRIKIRKREEPELTKIITKESEKLIGKTEPVEISEKSAEEQRIEQAKKVRMKMIRSARKITPKKILDFNPKTLKEITIADLKRIKGQKEKAEKERRERLGQISAEDMLWQSNRQLKKKQKQVSHELKEKFKEIRDQEEMNLFGEDVEVVED